MDKIRNNIVRICFIIMAISIISIGVIIYYAYNNNVIVNGNGYFMGLQTIIATDLTFIQILLLSIFVFLFIFSFVYLIYSKFGKINYKEIVDNKEKVIFMIIENSLITILITLIIVICTNSFILTDNRYNINTNIEQHNSNYNDGSSA